LKRLLLVDDDPCLLELLAARLRAEGFVCESAESLAEMFELLRRSRFDGILLDVHLGDEDGTSALPALMRDCPLTRVFVMTSRGTIEAAVHAMERGAASFLVKDGDPAAFVTKLCASLRGESAVAAEHSGGDRGPVSIGTISAAELGLVGNSPALAKVVEMIDILRDVDSRVLITGESGTGKEVVAKALHATSHRSAKRFEAINCGAIPENLLESELFGHKRGAFTDAKTDHKGFFETCSDGTLFLDEIGEMPLPLQVKLLRVLQESRVTPVGSNQSIKVNTRVIAATNRSLEEEVRAGRFREDLYYRISVLKIQLPSLRERSEDIPLLVNHFLATYNSRFGKSVRAPSQEVMARLIAWEWPGNIRELQNAVERGVVLSRDGDLHIEHMLEGRAAGLIENALDASPTAATAAAFVDYLALPLSEAKENFEKFYLRELLKVSRGNISEAARLCGRYRADIYRLMMKYGMTREAMVAGEPAGMEFAETNEVVKNRSH
jgi:two-component system response regulator GlrR